MSDLDRLKADLDFVVAHAPAPVSKKSSALWGVIGGARSWADLMEQEPIWWCRKHESQGHEPVEGYAFCIVVIAAMLNNKNLPGACRMVRVRLAEDTDE